MPRRAGIPALPLRDGGTGRIERGVGPHLGHFKRADSYNLLRSLLREVTFLGEYFSLDLSSSRLKRKDKTPSRRGGVARQHRHFAVLFLVGCTVLSSR
jgi:hypothetical protein